MGAREAGLRRLGRQEKRSTDRDLSRQAELEAISLLCWLLAWPRERGGNPRRTRRPG